MTKMLEECWTYLDSTQGISNGGTGGKHESSSLLFRFRPPLHGCMVAFGLYGVHSKHGWLSQNILIITLTRMYGSMIHIQNISFSFIMSHELWAITAPVPRYSSARIPETESHHINRDSCIPIEIIYHILHFFCMSPAGLARRCDVPAFNGHWRS